MAYTGDLHRGVWAGDRFDIVPIDEFTEREIGTDGEVIVWKDVSESVAKELKEILASEFPASLRSESDKPNGDD
ncbi:hypothetical protein EVG20_g3744 [Dentipellis fragilis]|uniref:Uncharacterized protein n=1 Tax=Dentipellis fragilis TaxID=205917 RepID=A0A4Y9Z232_9AGAM|nr:hypothetical protein EVG20_g3744 [Dentipellis fragilis]